MSDRDPLIGSTIRNRYRILRLLGEGGMGTVYEGRHLTIDRRVAIKRLHPHFAQNPQVLQRFHREALAATHTGNEHIIDVIDMDELDDGSPFMVLEYLDGTELEKLVEESGPLPLGRVMRIGVQICDALNAVHEAGIVHRDLNPGNIFLIPRGSNPDFVKVIDFGISKFKTRSTGQSTHLTTPGTFMGTPNFMAPEQIDESPEIDRRSDIFALGGILFYSLTANLPFLADSFYSLLVSICCSPHPSIRRYRTDLPAELDAIISRALAKDQSERYPSCTEMKQALWPYLDRVPDTISTVPKGANPFDSKDGNRIRIGNAESDPNYVSITSSIAPTSAPVRPSSPALRSVFSTSFARIPKRRWSIPLAALGAVIAFSIIMIPLIFLEEVSSNALPQKKTQPNRVSIVDGPSDLPTVVPPKPLNAADSDVEVLIGARPRNAKLYLDGRRVDNPFRGRLSEPDKTYRVKAVLNGRTIRRRFVPREKKKIRLVFTKTIVKASTQPSTIPSAAAITSTLNEQSAKPIIDSKQSDSILADTALRPDRSLNIPDRAAESTNMDSRPKREKSRFTPATKSEYPEGVVPPKRPPISIR